MPETPASADSLRPWFGLAAFYAASFAVLGVYMQFFPVWLHEQCHLGEAEIAIVLSAQTIARTIAGPLWAQRVDRTGNVRRVLVTLSSASAVAFALYSVSASFAWLWGCAFLFGCLYPPMHPILDAAGMQAAARWGFAYGRLRLVGSISFLLVILLVGWWLDRAGSAIVFVLLLAGLAATAGAATLLPRSPVDALSTPVERAPLWALLRSGPFVLLLIAAALIQGSHATYYNLSTVHWKANGIDEAAAGALWAEGVFAEIVLLFLARQSVEKLRPTTLLMLGGAAAVVRWLVIGSSTSLGVLIATNWLHAFTFTCTYLGSLRALERRVPPHQRSTAQGLLGAATSGVGMVLGGVLGGFVYERWAGRAFFVMAALAALGAGLAAILRRQANRAQSRLASSAENPPA